MVSIVVFQAGDGTHGALSPPMKSMATRSLSWPSMTRGDNPPRFHKRLTRRRRRASCRSAALARTTREASAQRTVDGASPDDPRPRMRQSQCDHHKVKMIDVFGLKLTVSTGMV